MSPIYNKNLLKSVCTQSFCIFLKKWAHKNMDVISKLQVRFLKLILGVKVTTPTCMVLGEVGRYPIETEAECRMLGF